MQYVLSGGIALVWGIAAPFSGLAQEGETPAEVPSRESLETLDVLIEVMRDGRVRVEQTFRLRTTGGTIQRGPVLHYLTVFRGPGGLVLDNGMEVEEVWRNGQPEPFRGVKDGGHLRLTCGSRDVFLEPGTHEYSIVSVARGDWRYENGMTKASVDVLGPFQSFPIDSVRLRFRLPDGVEMEKRTIALRAPSGNLIEHELSQTTTELLIQTTESLEPNSAFFLNAVWPSGGFSGKSHWLQILKQHPKLPLTAFTAMLLFCSLVLLVGRGRKKKGTAAQLAPTPG